METIDKILDSLDGVKKIGNQYTAFCPAHEDKRRSLSISGDGGKLLMYCFAGCSFADILSSLNIEYQNKDPIEEAVYDYTDKDGKLLYQVIRYYPKTFKQRRVVNGEYVWSVNGVERVLYNLPKVLNADKVYFVEGEKDCNNLSLYGVTATSISGGASSKWETQYGIGLENSLVAVIPDNDKAGREYSERVASSLYGWAKTVKILNIGSKDISEWLKTHNVDELETLWDTTKEYVPIGAVTRREFMELKGHVKYLHSLMNKHIYIYSNKGGGKRRVVTD